MCVYTTNSQSKTIAVYIAEASFKILCCTITAFVAKRLLSPILEYPLKTMLAEVNVLGIFSLQYCHKNYYTALSPSLALFDNPSNTKL